MLLSLDMERVRAEWPDNADGSTYLNTGSCGRKPVCVVSAVERAFRTFNQNPTIYTFLNEDWLETARQALSELFALPASDLLLLQSSTQGLHLVLNSFLLKPGDEMVSTTHEHGSLNAIARHLSETRGIVVKQHPMQPQAGSEQFCAGIISLVTEATRLVVISEIDGYSGWRPDLTVLLDWCRERAVPVLVDGAHSPGQGFVRADRFPLWVGSAHKWLCAPNGTAVLYAKPEWASLLKPVWFSDRVFNEFENPLRRFEYQGTTDTTNWCGLTAAVQLQQELGVQAIAERQNQLLHYLLARIDQIPGAEVRTPIATGETSGLLTVTWKPSLVPVPHLRDYLWERYRIWTQPDFRYGEPGHGLRLSCHISVEEKDLDRLTEALREIFRS